MALANRLAEHTPEIRAQLVSAAFGRIVARRTLVEDLRAFIHVGLGEIDRDRLLRRRAALSFLSDPLDRIAHLLRAFAMKHLTRHNRRAERDNAREQHPASDCVETI